MQASHTWALTLSILALGIVPAAWTADVDDQARLIEQRMEEARAELDKAARTLAELHSQMWQLETEGPRSQRPMLGILVDDSDSSDGGIDLVGVTPDGGAEQAGLKTGDRIVAINAMRLDGDGGRKALPLYSQAMSTVQAGETVSVEYVRDGATRHVDVVTRARGTYMAKVAEEEGPWLEGLRALEDLEDLEALEGLEELNVLKGGKLDLSGNVMRVPADLRLEDVEGELAGYFEVDRGVLVLGVPQREQALKAGDILVEIDRKPAANADAALEHLAKLEGKIPATVKRGGEIRELTLDADALNADQALQVMGGDRRIRIQRHGEGEQVRLEITVED